SAEALEAQLKLYKDYLIASKKLEGMIGEKKFSFTREKIAFNFTPAFSPPQDLKAKELSDIFLEIFNRIDYVVNLPQRVISRVASLKEMVFSFRSRLAELGKVSFKNFLSGTNSRDEMVVSFMAVLELIKSGEAAVTQKGIFDDIILEKI
ncbi:MAG: segregation/condensation protein A, partial [Patescibacteria group bacterium]